MTTVWIPLHEDGTGAARYLAWVAYPGTDDAAKRRRWVEVALVIPYKKRRIHPPGMLRGLNGDHLFGVYSRGVKRLHFRRRPAVWLMANRMKSIESGGLAPMAAYRQLLSNLPGESGLLDEKGDDLGTLKRLCWRESLPALAMAVPLSLLTSRNIGYGLTWDELVYRKDVPWINWAIALANHVAKDIEYAFQPMRRLLVPTRLDGVVPRLKSPVFLPQDPTQIGLLVDSQYQLPDPKR